MNYKKLLDENFDKYLALQKKFVNILHEEDEARWDYGIGLATIQERKHKLFKALNNALNNADFYAYQIKIQKEYEN